jgi:hypothetical protein
MDLTAQCGGDEMQTLGGARKGALACRHPHVLEVLIVEPVHGFGE